MQKVRHQCSLYKLALADRASDTVEKNILDLAAKRGLSLYTKDHAVGTLQVTSFDMDDAGQAGPYDGNKSNRKQKGQKGDFILKWVQAETHRVSFRSLMVPSHRSDDMLAVLFPHLFEDTEYLVPQSEAANGLTFDFDETIPEDATMDYDTLPVAGPSRLS